MVGVVLWQLAEAVAGLGPGPCCRSLMQKSNRLQLFPDTTTIENNALSIGGHELAALAGKFGTPLYVYDRATMDGVLARYKAALKASLSGYGTHHVRRQGLLVCRDRQVGARSGAVGGLHGPKRDRHGARRRASARQHSGPRREQVRRRSRSCHSQRRYDRGGQSERAPAPGIHAPVCRAIPSNRRARWRVYGCGSNRGFRCGRSMPTLRPARWTASSA